MTDTTPRHAPSTGVSHRALGYCTNVHPGPTLDETKRNLEQHALAVKRQFRPEGPLGIGLWLPARSARQLRATGAARFADWLAERGLAVFTINGFPAGDFHRPVVKHRVYRPSWCEEERLQYTEDLVHVLAALVPEGGEGSISTLPVGWKSDVSSDLDRRRAAQQLMQAARVAADVEQQTGRYIHIDLEPEPGCVLERSSDVATYYNRFLLTGAFAPMMRRYVRVCHDVCHSAVMFEDQAQAIRAYDALGVSVGKVQVSSAIAARFRELDEEDRGPALDQLKTFNEQRYLHQTMVRTRGESAEQFFEDLPEALASPLASRLQDTEWRVHFHVPIFLAHLGLLETTQDEIHTCLGLLGPRDEVRHYEVETYAWDVLPESPSEGDIAEGIARELRWLTDVAADGFFE